MPRERQETMHAVARLWRLMDDLSLASSVAEIYEVGIRSVRTALDVPQASIMIEREGTMQTVAHAALAESSRSALETLANFDACPDGFEPRMYSTLDGVEGAETLRRDGIVSVAVAPLYFQKRLFGALALCWEAPHSFDEREVAVMRAVASHVAFALAHRRIEDELAHRLREEQAAHQERLASEQRLVVALDAAVMGTWEWDVTTGRVTWSEELQALHGLEPGQFTGDFEGFQRDMHPDDRDSALAKVKAAFDGDADRYANQYRIIRPDGSVRWIEAKGRIFRDDDGNPTRLLGVCGDITERKMHEMEREFLSEAARHLASSLDQTTLLSELVQLAVPRIGDWCVLYLGAPGEAPVVAEVAHSDPAKVRLALEATEKWPPRADEGEGSIAWVIESGESVLAERIPAEALEQFCRDEEHLDVMLRLGLHSSMVVPLKAGGQVVGALALMSSESLRQYTPDDLIFAEELAARAALAFENARLYEEARRAVRAREDVLAVVSHDLRNPINTIAAACALYELPVDEAKKKKGIASIKRAIGQMDQLIQNLLDVSRIDAGKLVLEREWVPVAAALGETADMFRALVDDKGVALEVVAPQGLEVWADPGTLQQVLGNLVGNAVKYVQPGGHIALSGRKETDGVAITVRDDGAGISPDQLPHLFERYWQARDGSHGGAGLGLAICKGIVEAHDGRITAASKLGEGAEFTVFLPTPTGARRPVQHTIPLQTN